MSLGFLGGRLAVAVNARLRAFIGAPGVLAAEAVVGSLAGFDPGKRAVGAGAFGVEPVTIRVEVIFDKIWLDGDAIFWCQRFGGVFPRVAFHG